MASELCSNIVKALTFWRIGKVVAARNIHAVIYDARSKCEKLQLGSKNMAKQPNIVIFMVDQLTAFALKTYGGTVCKTPNIDAFADSGVVFENAYCAYPLCAPSRFAMMTGRLPSRIDAFDNGAEFPASIPTFAHYLRLLGYYTCISGKMHFVGPDQYHGFEERLTTEIYPADFSWTPAAGYKDITLDDERPYTAGVSTIETVLDAGPIARSMQIDYDEEVIHQAIRELFSMARTESAPPFMMTVSLTHPHDPYVITQEHWDRYDDNDIEQPRVPFIPVEQRDQHSQSLYYHYGQDKTEISDVAYCRARRGYYGMISYVDDLFGRVLATLRDTGFAENTVVLLTSDHGDMIGERGMWFKKTLFEPAVRIPLVIAHPGRASNHIKTPVSLVDILPTLLDIAGAPDGTLQTACDGRSLAPALNGDSIEQRPVYVEHIDGGTVAPRVMVRDGDMKLVHSRAYPPQLYDLVSDPDEQNNLASDENLKLIIKRLTGHAEEVWDLDTLSGVVFANQTARKLIDTALDIGRREPWDFTPHSARETQRYVRHGDAFPNVERRGYLTYRK